MADKVLHIDSSGNQYGKLLPPISGDLDDLEPANQDSEPLAIAVFQLADPEPYLDDDYMDEGYVELGLYGSWKKMDFATLKAWLDAVEPDPDIDVYLEPDYVEPDYVGE